MFRATRRLLAAAPSAVKEAASLRTKLSTGITGIAVHPEPLSALANSYQSTLKVLEAIPASAVYRQSAEAITRERLDVVKRVGADKADEASIEQVEQAIGAGIVEELIMQANDELKLAGKMIEFKACACLAPLHPVPLELTPLSPRRRPRLLQVGGPRGGTGTRAVGAVPCHPVHDHRRRPPPQLGRRCCRARGTSEGGEWCTSEEGQRRRDRQ